MEYHRAFKGEKPLGPIETDSGVLKYVVKGVKGGSEL